MEQMIAGYFTKPLLGNLFTTMRDIIMGAIPYPAKERVENKLCPGTECQEIKSSTNDKGNKQASGRDTVPNITQKSGWVLYQVYYQWGSTEGNKYKFLQEKWVGHKRRILWNIW